ncbi:MAG: thioether cross-link-forming SCIFF peptide maturase [Oscillospiraceae bacterium]|nr:thioether cross-link-forming SCIFF peptide maturase [Oscillospiraceae bacterium]
MVHIFKCLDMNFAVDVNSGAVHVLDDLAYAILEMNMDGLPEKAPEIEGYAAQQCAEALEELRELENQGMLFTDDGYDAARAIPVGAPVKALCLHVSHDCNLRCGYCFAATGDFGTGRRMNMDIETAKKAIDFVIERSGVRRNIEIDFFGGEPLLAFDTVKAAVDYARSIEKEKGKNFRFTITTNGLLLDDDKIEYINREMDNCVLSLDGRREVNDNWRFTTSGKGSYDVIVPKYKKLVDERGDKSYYVRGTFTRDNLDFANDVVHIAQEGFYAVSVEPVSAPDGCGYEIREEDLPRVYDEYDRLARIMLERDDFSFFHFTVDLAQGPCVIKRMRGCGAGCEYVAVTPEGDIYPCHQFVGREEYRMGNVFTGEFDKDASNDYAALNIYSREECRKCWARFYCSGGCSAANVNMNGDITKPWEIGCKLEKKRLECAIALQAAKS